MPYGDPDSMSAAALLQLPEPCDTEIWAQLPAEVVPGTYLLTVSRGQGSVKNDSFNLTIGAVVR